MMINPHEMNSYGRSLVERRRQEADAYRLAQAMSGPVQDQHKLALLGDAIRRTVRGLLDRSQAEQTVDRTQVDAR